MADRIRPRKQLAELKGSYRYGLVLMLTLLSAGLQMALPDTRGSLLAQALLMALTLVTALFAEGASAAQWRHLGGFIAISVIGLIVTAIAGKGQTERAIIFGLSGILAVSSAVVVTRGVVGGIRVERRVTLHSVMGALTVYLLAGMIFAFAYATMEGITGNPVLSHLGTSKHAEEVYFSFITLTTVGYGDIAPISNASRMTSALEALFGQLYLVTIVAVIVSNVSARGRRLEAGASDPTTPGAGASEGASPEQ